MSGLSIIQNKLEEFKCSANEAVNFKLVRKESDVFDDATTFKPDMSHQIFGDSETIFGYKDFQLKLFYSAARLTMYLNMSYSEKISPQKFDGIYADDVMKSLVDHVPPNYLTNLDDFITYLSKEETFKPFGELLHTYTVSKDGADRKFEIYKADILAPGFREWHQSLQTFLLWYVDAATYIEVDDERWNFYLVFEKYLLNGQPMYAVVGYMTVYNYFAYPAHLRPRISQVLILPPFQRQGHAATLIETFYNDVVPRSDIQDITVEDPSENFQRVRDYVDAKKCMKLKSYQPDLLKDGFSDEMAWEAKNSLRINKRQARRIYEILRLKVTDYSNPEEFRLYRLNVKNRLNAPLQKNGRDFEKLQRVLRPDELNATMNDLTTEQKLTYLESTFQELLVEYKSVIERLSSS